MGHGRLNRSQKKEHFESREHRAAIGIHMWQSSIESNTEVI